MSDLRPRTPPRWGRLPRAHNPGVPHLSALKLGRGVVPAAIPVALDYTAPLPADQGMEGNDQVGDCTCAFVAHAIQVWSRFAGGSEIVIPTALSLQFYRECTGWDGVPGSPSDTGARVQDVLARWVRVGFPMPDGTRNRLRGFFEIDPTIQDDVERAIYECGAVDVGFNVPAWLEQGEPPDVWGSAPAGGSTQYVGGHCVGWSGYTQQPPARDDDYVTMSWARDYLMTRRFSLDNVDETYALVSDLWVERTGLTPLGMSLDDVDAQMAAIQITG